MTFWPIPEGSSLPRFVGALAAALLALAGCGGGDGGAAPPPAATNTPPVAAFTSATSVIAGAPLAFDASAASDADGDALTYSWAFGNGQRGGGKQIAALFADPGDHLVRLTVGDGRGSTASIERMVTVTAGPAAAGSVAALTIVRDASGALLPGVTVANVGGGAPGVTGADGRTSVGADRSVSTTLRFSKPGFADQFKAFTLPASAESGYLEVMMTPRMAATTLADAAAGGTIDGSDGARVSFEPGSLVDGAGAPVVGAVQVSITPIDIAANVRAFPGKFEGTRPTGQQGLIESYGTAEFILTQGGAPVQLAPGRKATIEIPIYTAKNRDGSAVKEGDPFPLWSLNERTGTWIEEGNGNVVVAASPSGFALRGEVTHFSWWNHDQFLFPIAKPKPKCLVDTNADGILEDLTGTGHCWHAGTGPDQPTAFAPLATGSDRKRILAEPRTQRIPTWVAEDFTPASGGKVLLIPANLDITFRSYAKNGTLFGTTVVRLGADVEQDVPMLLEPVQDNPGTQAIALPFDDRFAVATRAEVDRFTFAAEAGAAYDILISRATSSLLGGSVRVLGVDGASAASGNFGTDAYAAVVTASAAGTMTVEVTAGDAAPGSYRIEVRKLAGNGGNCTGPATTLVLPSTGEHPIAANGSLCFALPLVADDAIEILNASTTVARGNVRLLGPNGEQIAIDGYGGSAGASLLRFAAAQTGTYRLQVSNTEPLAGTIHGLAVARLSVAGTLDLTNNIDYSDVSTVSTGALFVVKPGATSHLAIKIATDGSGYGAAVWPDNFRFTTSGTGGRIIRTTPSALPVIEVFRTTATSAWQFTLTARVAETIALNSDLALAAPAPDDVLLYRVDGSAGQEWSIGTSFAPSMNFNPAVALHSPVSLTVPLTASNRVYTLPENGPYTVEVRNSSPAPAGTPFNLRVNTVAALEAITLSASTERTATLALGEVKRYSFNVTQGQVLALQLSTPGVLDAQATIAGGNVYDGFVSLVAPAKTRYSGARYVGASAAAQLLVYGTSRLSDRATGQVTVAVQAPAPSTSLPDVAFSGDIVPSTLLTYGYNLAADGKYLVCLSYSGPTSGAGFSLVTGTVWGPSAQSSNYTGDLGISGLGNSFESLGNLRAGSNTLSLLSTVATTTSLNGRLVPLPAAEGLAVGASASNGSLAACQRRYFRFSAATGTSYTVRLTAQFAGSVRVRKEASAPGDYTTRTDTINLGGTPLPLTTGIERVLTFTVPSAAPHGSGNYIVEIDGDGEAAGAYAVLLTTP